MLGPKANSSNIYRPSEDTNQFSDLGEGFSPPNEDVSNVSGSRAVRGRWLCLCTCPVQPRPQLTNKDKLRLSPILPLSFSQPCMPSKTTTIHPGYVPSTPSPAPPRRRPYTPIPARDMAITSLREPTSRPHHPRRAIPSYTISSPPWIRTDPGLSLLQNCSRPSSMETGPVRSASEIQLVSNFTSLSIIGFDLDTVKMLMGIFVCT
ncbi:hypothetical protein B0H17DRAFT_140563 [Mycena rosella]|uniref:Uncharacterized protein n=1 Tax=Mycena rosella TaxID=1033263 RepID=A0AAD7GR93_MYCRO|nr:hypothetical protein B0H17DRAFT_140563 [Mycena rosella]